MIEELRDAYKKCEPLLSTKAETAGEEQIEKTLKEQFLMVAGSKKDEVKKMNLDEMSDEEQRLVGMTTGSGSRQKVIPVQEEVLHRAGIRLRRIAS
ncbi:MAG: hypothetical protein JRN39_01210 [Nitrososphaerota archaeon]|nr:hypothetical protein [Nitrososphaerota archaeon]